MAAPRPVVDGLFADSASGPRLLVGRCALCHRTHFPATTTCPYCGAEECRRAEAGPEARLWLYTVVYTRPPGYGGPIPYGFGIVELPDGLRVVTRLTESEVDRLQPDQAMHLVLDTLTTTDDGTPIISYAFAPGPAA